MREQIVNQEKYPASILAALEASGNCAISVANRWILGWPERVDRLIESGAYLETLKTQTSLELDADAEAVSDGLENLAPWEINQRAGLDPAPPSM